MTYLYKDNPTYKKIYQAEEDFNKEIAKVIDKIVRKLELKNVIAMGKCADGYFINFFEIYKIGPKTSKIKDFLMFDGTTPAL